MSARTPTPVQASITPPKGVEPSFVELRRRVFATEATKCGDAVGESSKT